MLQPFSSLGGTRVLDLTDRWGQFAGKLLAQLGLDVVMGEPEGGHPLRNAWPCIRDTDGRPVSVYFWHFNLGKRSTLFDTRTEEGRERAAALVEAADVVLAGEESYRQLAERMPDVLSRTHVVVMSAYGLESSDPERDDDLHVCARSGMAGLSGYGPEEHSMPIVPPAEQPMHSAGIYGAIAAMLALRLPGGTAGQLFDVSAQAAAFQGTEMLYACWAYRKERLRRRGGGYATPFPTGRWQVPTADGSYFYAFGFLPRTQREWNDLKDWMRRENAIQDLDDPAYEKLQDLRSADPFDISPTGQHVNEVIRDFISTMDGDEAYREAQAIKMGWAKVFQPQETLTESQFLHRRLFHRTAWSGSDRTYLTQSLPWIIHSDAVVEPSDEIVRPPAVGEHTEAVAAEWTARQG